MVSSNAFNKASPVGSLAGASEQQITIATGSLAEAIAAREEDRVDTLLDNLTTTLSDKPFASVPVEALIAAWTSCGQVLDAGLSIEVSDHVQFTANHRVFGGYTAAL